MDFSDFVNHLRSALNHLYDPNYLRRSPLAQFFGLDGRFNTPLAFQELLIDSIENLRPDDDAAAQSRDLERYHILQYRYVEQFTQDEVALQLGVSARQLRRKQTAALEVLACKLWETYLPRTQTKLDEENAVKSDEPLEETQDFAEDLAWLDNAAHNQQTNLHASLQTINDLVQPLARKNQVELVVRTPANRLHAAIHPTALRQALLSCLNILISLVQGKEIRLILSESSDFQAEIRIECYPSPGILPEKIEPALVVARQLLEPGRGNVRFEEDDFNIIFNLPIVGSIRILLIDDNLELFQFIERILENTRYQLAYSQNASALSEMITIQQPDMILLDIMMPEVDGLELMGRLREHPETGHIPVVICSILPQESLALALGARAFISKPIDRGELLDTLNEIANEL